MGNLGLDFWETKKAEIENKAIQYPSYYTREYHGYSQGNLCWEAAHEAEIMSKVASIKAVPDVPAEDAETILRNNYMTSIINLIGKEKANEVKNALDMACGIGNSTISLADAFPSARVTGLDLSPYFLAVAKYRFEGDERYKDISWCHAAAENSELEANSFDIITVVGAIHELPQTVMSQLVSEVYRILKKGGSVAFIDVNQENIKKMPSLIYLLFKSTEPDMDDYLELDLPNLLSKEFEKVQVDSESINRRVLTVATK